MTAAEAIAFGVLVVVVGFILAIGEDAWKAWRRK